MKTIMRAEAPGINRTLDIELVEDKKVYSAYLQGVLVQSSNEYSEIESYFINLVSQHSGHIIYRNNLCLA
jgi:hypothetical protein